MELGVEAEVAVVEGVGGGDAALEVVEGAVAFVVGLAHGAGFFGLPEAVDFVGEELGVDAGEAALEPFGADHGVDGGGPRGYPGGGAGPVSGVIFVDRGLEEVWILSGDDVGVGEDTGFEGVEGGAGLAGSVVGPVEFSGLRRLASVCFCVVMVRSLASRNKKSTGQECCLCLCGGRPRLWPWDAPYFPYNTRASGGKHRRRVWDP